MLSAKIESALKLNFGLELGLILKSWLIESTIVGLLLSRAYLLCMTKKVTHILILFWMSDLFIEIYTFGVENLYLWICIYI